MMEGYYFDHALLISCIDGLGRFNERLGVYEKELDTTNCLKDIDRFLRRDFEDTKQALLTMGKCNVVSQNLLPLLKTNPSDRDVVYHTMRVLVLMSMPPQDNYPSNIKDIHHSIKAEFTNSDALGILMSMCHEPLSHFDDLSDSHYKTLQMFVTFIRNMMIIPDSEERGNSSSKHHYSTLQVDFLKISFQENVLELVGLIAQHMGTKTLKSDAPAMLDLLHGIYSAFDPRSVLGADATVLLTRTKARCATAEDLRNADTKPSTISVKPENPVHASIQHIQTSKPQLRQPSSNPGLKLMGHSGEHAFYVKTVPGTLGQVVLKNAARTKAATKVQATVNALSQPLPRPTNAFLLASVKVYTSQLLRGAFNALMSVARDEAALGLNICSMPAKSMLRFFELSAWFMQYCRYQEEARAKESSKTALEKASNTASSLYQSTSSILSWKMIHAVLRVWLEMIDTDGKQKKETDWRLQEASIKVLKEALSLLDLAFHYGSAQDRKAADMLQRRLLQDDTKEAGVLNRITQSMRQFKKHDKRIARQEGRESRAYAVDMVKTMHIVLRVYSRLCKDNFSAVRTSSHRIKRDTGPQPTAPPPGEGESDGQPPETDGTGGCPAEDGTGEDIAADTDQNEDCTRQLKEGGGEHEEDAEDCIEETVPQRRVEFAAVLKSASHVEILKLYMFLLQKYKALDAATLHAIAAYLGRLCNELRLEPMLYQISYLRQFHIILSDESIKNRPMYNSLRKIATRISSHLIARLDPKPISLPDPSSAMGRDPTQVGDDQDAEDIAARAANDEDLKCLPAQTRQDTLAKIQDRVTKMLFVELLFEKGPRESEMIQVEYSWRKALQDRAERRMDHQQITDDQDGDDEHPPTAPGHPSPDKARAAAESSDDEDALPQAGAAKQAPHRPTRGLAAGLQMTAEEQLRFKALFETVNGSRSAKQLLMAEWNQQEQLQMTAKQVTNTMAALRLKQGELTHEQEEKLSLLVEEFGHMGRRAYKRIADAFPGGFSSAAIKKHVARLNLTLPTSSKPNHNLEDLEELQDAGDDMGGDGAVQNARDRKRSRKGHRSVDAGLANENGCDSSGSEDMPHLPAAKKRRSSVCQSDDESENSSIDQDGSPEQQPVPSRPAMPALEDDVSIDIGTRANILASSDDDEGACAPAAARKCEEQQSAGQAKVRRKRVEVSDRSRAKSKNVKKAKHMSQKPQAAGKSQKHPSKGSRAAKLGKTGKLSDATTGCTFDVQAVTKAANRIKDDLKAEDSIGDVNASDIIAVLGDMLAGNLEEQQLQDGSMVHLGISPQNEAEEHVMEMSATESLLEALGLYFADTDDPSVWSFDGSAQELHEILQTLIEYSLTLADGECLTTGQDGQCSADAMPQAATTVHASALAAGLLDDEEEEEGGHISLPPTAGTAARSQKQQRALLSDDEDDDGGENGIQAADDAQLCVPDAAEPVVAQDAHQDTAEELPPPDSGLSAEVQTSAVDFQLNPSVPDSEPVEPELEPTEKAVSAVAEPVELGPDQPVARKHDESMHAFVPDAPVAEDVTVSITGVDMFERPSTSAVGPATFGEKPCVPRDCGADPAAAVNGLCASDLDCRQSEPNVPGLGDAPATACATADETIRPNEASHFVDATDGAGVPEHEYHDKEMRNTHLVQTGHAASQVQLPTARGAVVSGGFLAQDEPVDGGHHGPSDDVSPQPWPIQERSSGDGNMMTPIMNSSHSGLLRTRSATRSVTFSDVTTDLVSGPTHEWQGSRQRRTEGVEDGPAGTLRLPRPALKSQCRAAGAEQRPADDSPPLQAAAEGSIQELPPSFGLSPENEAMHTAQGAPRLGRTPLSPIKVNTPRRSGKTMPPEPLSASLISLPGSQGKRPRTKKARLEAMRASQEANRSPAAHKLEGSAEQKVAQDAACTPNQKGLSARASNVPH